MQDISTDSKRQEVSSGQILGKSNWYLHYRYIDIGIDIIISG